MKSLAKKILILVIAAPLVAFFILEARFSYLYSTQRRAANRFLIPDHYQGWVVIKSGDPQCPPIQIESGSQLHPIKDDGTFCTSSQPQPGWGDDVYVYKSEPQVNLLANPGADNAIWHEDHLIGKPEGVSFYVFHVGNKLNKSALQAAQSDLDSKLSLLSR